ncbi:MAG: hypothetical protein LBL35_00840 [Clostridiales bacterium]|jgi:hypothetical protein|nr:hypothetical protein [Clostridiales bacterium]
MRDELGMEKISRLKNQKLRKMLCMTENEKNSAEDAERYAEFLKRRRVILNEILDLNEKAAGAPDEAAAETDALICAILLAERGLNVSRDLATEEFRAEMKDFRRSKSAVLRYKGAEEAVVDKRR